jgi:hypothetical protein
MELGAQNEASFSQSNWMAMQERATHCKPFMISRIAKEYVSRVGARGLQRAVSAVVTDQKEEPLKAIPIGARLSRQRCR